MLFTPYRLPPKNCIATLIQCKYSSSRVRMLSEPPQPTLDIIFLIWIQSFYQRAILFNSPSVLPVFCLLSWHHLTQHVFIWHPPIVAVSCFVTKLHISMLTRCASLTAKGNMHFWPLKFLKCHCQCLCSGRLYSNLLKYFFFGREIIHIC